MKTLIERVFDGNDEMYNRAVAAVAEAEAKFGLDAPVKLDTAYNIPCLYAMTGIKATTIGDCKNALEGVIKDYMTREKRTKDESVLSYATTETRG